MNFMQCLKNTTIFVYFLYNNICHVIASVQNCAELKLLDNTREKSEIKRTLEEKYLHDVQPICVASHKYATAVR